MHQSYRIVEVCDVAMMRASKEKAFRPGLHLAAKYLIRLCHISKDSIHHGNQHAVLLRMPSILNDGNDIGSVLCHVYQISACKHQSNLGKQASTTCQLSKPRGHKDVRCSSSITLLISNPHPSPRIMPHCLNAMTAGDNDLSRAPRQRGAADSIAVVNSSIICVAC